MLMEEKEVLWCTSLLMLMLMRIAFQYFTMRYSVSKPYIVQTQFKHY